MKRRMVFLVVSALLVLVAAGAAFAYWTAPGSGSGSGSTGTLQPVTVDAFVGGDSPSSVLVPGGTADVIVRVKNTNAYTVKLITVTGGPAAITTAHSGCSAADVTFTNQSGRSDVIAASETTLVHLANAASMTSSAASACQGATFTIPVTITVQTP